MYLGADNKPEHQGTWADAAGAFTGALLDSAGYGSKASAPVKTKTNMTPWIIGGGLVLASGLALFMLKK